VVTKHRIHAVNIINSTSKRRATRLSMAMSASVLRSASDSTCFAIVLWQIALDESRARVNTDK
jgi:hypothetical protein